MALYLHLCHGRAAPSDVLTDWGTDGPTIKIFDPTDDAKEEKTVIAGAGNFEMSADRKKLLVFKGGSNLTVVEASAGGGKSGRPTGGMLVVFALPNPRKVDARP